LKQAKKRRRDFRPDGPGAAKVFQKRKKEALKWPLVIELISRLIKQGTNPIGGSS
jgi:hypothetical protein